MGMGGGVNYGVLIKVTSPTAQAPPLIKEHLETRRASLALRKCHHMNKIFHRSHLENASAQGGLLKL